MAEPADPDRLSAFVAIAAGLLLAVLAGPAVLAGLTLIPGNETLAALGRGERPPPARLAAAAAGRRAALFWLDTAQIRTELAALELARAAEPALAPPVRHVRVEAALADLRIGLAAGPARPYGWTQYAEAMLARGARPASLDGPFRLSLATGRHEPRLVMRRIELAFRAWPHLAEDLRLAVRQQIGLAAAGAPRSLAEFARERYALGWVRSALADRPALLRRFDAAYFGLPVR